MYKLIVKLSLFLLFFGGVSFGTPVYAVEKNEFDEYITLQSVSLNKTKNDIIEINLKTDKPFLAKPLIFEKNKNVYLISLIATNYNGDRNIDASNLLDDVVSVTVDFIPYKINTDQGYTRIIVNTKSKQQLVVREHTGLFSSQIFQILIIVFAVIILFIAAYLVFALYTKMNKRKNKVQIVLDSYDNNSVADGVTITENSDNDVVQDEQSKFIQEVADEDNLGVENPADISSSQDDMQLSPEEIVQDILNNESVIEEISETIADDDIRDNYSGGSDSIQVSGDENSDEVESPSFPDEFVKEDFGVEDNIDRVFDTDETLEQIRSVAQDDESDFEDVNEDILDEISFDTLQGIVDNSSEILDEAFSDEISETNVISDAQNDPIEEKTTNLANNDYTINGIHAVSGGDTAIASKSFDFTSNNIDNYSQDNKNYDSASEEEDISPFDALGFSGIMADDLNIEEDTFADNADSLEIDEEILPAEPNTELQENTISDEASLENIDILDDINADELIEEETKNIADVNLSQDIVKISDDSTFDEQVDDENKDFGSESPSPKEEIDDFIVESASREESIEDNPIEIQDANEEEIVVRDVAGEDDTQNYDATDIEKYIVSSNEETEDDPVLYTPIDINTESFFNDDDVENVPDSTEKFFVESKPINTNDESASKNETKNIPDKNARFEYEPIDDNEPIVIDKKYFTKNKPLYLIRHKGQYSLVAMIKDDVFVLEKFDNKPNKEEIILSHNEKRKDDDVYIVKVGSWRALISVSKDNVKNILTL